MLSNSFMVSADNAHAIHPNHPEYADANNAPVMNGGVVLKFNARLSYSTDGVAAAIFRSACAKADVKVQTYCNRADMPGGSTLGHISLSHVSVPTADIGLPQLAMHSAYETAGADDTAYLVRALRHLFASKLLALPDGGYEIS
jgi:aspartyl aminopeptidase